MSRSLSLPALLAAAALFLTAGAALAPAANAQATRTWVSGVGDDANPCSRTAPCKTFAGSISKTAAGGEINAIDSAGFGALTITKAITIDTSNVIGGVLNYGSHGIIVNAGPNDDVVLRGLDINGATIIASPPPCPYAGESGIRILRARSVRIKDSKIYRQTKAIEVAPTNPVNVLVNRVDMSENCDNGVVYTPGSAGTANVMVQDSTISGSGTALSVSTGGTAWLTRTTLFANALGFQTLGTGTINDFGDNRLIANSSDGAATNNLGPKVVPGPAGAAGPVGPQGPQGEPAIKLLLAASQSSVAGKAGKAVLFSYAATANAKSTLTILKGTKKVATVTGTSKAGANTIRWNGKAGKKAAAAGAYKLVLSAVGADGQKATTSVALKLKR